MTKKFYKEKFFGICVKSFVEIQKL